MGLLKVFEYMNAETFALVTVSLFRKPDHVVVNRCRRRGSGGRMRETIFMLVTV